MAEHGTRLQARKTRRPTGTQSQVPHQQQQQLLLHKGARPCMQLPLQAHRVHAERQHDAKLLAALCGREAAWGARVG